MATTTPFTHAFCRKCLPVQGLSKNGHRILTFLSCQGSDPNDSTDKKKDKIEHEQVIPRLLLAVDKLGKRWKKNLSPQKKGDWKDLTLMSLSFAVYVYISQQIVSAYFTWMSMPRQPW